MRLADLLAGLSRLADLGFGLSSGESLRSAVLAVTLSRSLDLPDEDVRASMYTALLLHVGCVGYAHETVQLFGDEFVLNLAAERTNRAERRDVAGTLLPALTHGRPPLVKLQLAVAALTRGRRFGHAYDTVSCEVGRDAARRLGLPEDVQRSIYHSSEWWNGGGAPEGLAADAVPVGARIAMLTSVAVLFDTAAGRDAAIDAVRERGGGMLDPRLVERFTAQATALLDEVDADDPRDLLLAAEPPPVMSVPEPKLREVAAVFGDLADLKTPATYGHSRGVAALARSAGEQLGLAAAALAELEVAGSRSPTPCGRSKDR